MGRWGVLLGTMAALVLAGGVAAAHAMFERAEPAVGSTVPTPPKEVRLFFSEKIEPAFSTVRVTDAAGDVVDRGDAAVDSRDAAVLHVSLGPLVPGVYRVLWRVVSVDTHTTEGDFTFTVGR